MKQRFTKTSSLFSIICSYCNAKQVAPLFILFSMFTGRQWWPHDLLFRKYSIPSWCYIMGNKHVLGRFSKCVRQTDIIQIMDQHLRHYLDPESALTSLLSSWIRNDIIMQFLHLQLRHCVNKIIIFIFIDCLLSYK